MKNIRFFQSIQSKLIIIYVLLILIAMQLIGVYFYRTLESYYKNDFIEARSKNAELISIYAEQKFDDFQKGKTDEKKLEAELGEVNNLFAISQTEIQIIDSNGQVLTTSVQGHKNLVGQKNTQTEVTLALQGIRDNQRIFTDTDGIRKMVLAKPIGSDVRPVGAVYIVSSMEELYKTMTSINQILIVGTAIALALTGVLGVTLSSTITKPIKEITRQATAAAEGKFDQQVKVYGKDEISQLGHTFNFMMNRLKEALSINEEEKEKLSSILANMNDGVIATDDSGRVIVMNRRAKQILQVKEEQWFGKPLSRLLGISQEIVTEYSQHENTTLLELKLDEDEKIWVRVTFTPIHRRGEGITGSIAVLQDVTEQEKLERSRKEFVANVSHELRTPLTTIKSYLEALGDGAIEDPQLSERFLGVTRNETERMIRLVTDLLHLSRLDSNQATLVKTPTNISDMLEEVADRFAVQSRQRKIRIDVSVDARVGSISIDRDKIDQVLDNLLSNAIKYTADEGIVRIQAKRLDHDWVEISVEDTGIGIPKKDLSRIFERFYRVDKARSRNMGGTGLGLSIAREIVKAHGGSIQLESEYNVGTRVSFTLPVHHEEEDRA
ncbi:cell wall metabolism sensor histidine kinase WalK [Paenibacillus larvae]|uniref:cell wall metabolism sensor histidine kinase WalK n=1 Tax=Paenibacillus larvae TaxID=1464 RepID=UPI00227EFDBA|nr:cell wall metabolism sensor histidine kinase WalK [Paenibacillus larvae]MCY7475263.1 cell wall metabolism sensor histidine kinase WalK [Paenibacillus larvae]MDE5165359.1 cell wall metabolism sensor histidine kinase WalK [Paenibacillus larvae subsp. larvae]